MTNEERIQVRSALTASPQSAAVKSAIAIIDGLGLSRAAKSSAKVPLREKLDRRGSWWRGLLWKSGPPPHVGWWRTRPFSDCFDAPNWRWWDGKFWSDCVYAMESPTEAGAHSEVRALYHNDVICWCDYWPKDARVPRVKP